jgi:hypothetical protein
VHDKSVADAAQLTFPPGSRLHQDSGFQGFAPEGVIICQPKKKPRGQDRPAGDIIWNTVMAHLRITAEHVIAGVKRCRIVKDRFRNTKPHFADRVMQIACGLHNLRAVIRQYGDARQKVPSA